MSLSARRIMERCKDGISHNPALAIAEADAATGAGVLYHFIRNFRPRQRAAR